MKGGRKFGRFQQLQFLFNHFELSMVADEDEYEEEEDEEVDEDVENGGERRVRHYREF